MALYEDRQGDLWVGTFGGGLARIAGDSGAVIRYPFGERRRTQRSARQRDCRGCTRQSVDRHGGRRSESARSQDRALSSLPPQRSRSEQSQRRRDLRAARRSARRSVDRHGRRRSRPHDRQLRGAGCGALREPVGRRRHDAAGRVRRRIRYRRPPVAQHEQRPDALRSAHAHRQDLPRGARSAGRRFQLRRSLSRPRRHAVLRRQQRLQRVCAERRDQGCAAAARRADFGRQAQSAVADAGAGQGARSRLQRQAADVRVLGAGLHVARQQPLLVSARRLRRRLDRREQGAARDLHEPGRGRVHVQSARSERGRRLESGRHRDSRARRGGTLEYAGRASPVCGARDPPDRLRLAQAAAQARACASLQSRAGTHRARAHARAAKSAISSCRSSVARRATSSRA